MLIGQRRPCSLATRRTASIFAVDDERQGYTFKRTSRATFPNTVLNPLGHPMLLGRFDTDRGSNRLIHVVALEGLA